MKKSGAFCAFETRADDPLLPDVVPLMVVPVPQTASVPGQVCLLLRADDIFVSQGVNLGDALEGPDQVSPGDIYTLEPGATALRMVLSAPQDGVQRVVAGSEIGQAGGVVLLEAHYTLMSDEGEKVELVILALDDGTRLVLPLSPLAARADYALIQVQKASRAQHLADLICLSFGRGTMITLADGRQMPIEALRPGMRVLTRDHGGQELRWIGHARMKAAAAFAPVVITAGTLGNSGDLIVGQHHRIFLYQRQKIEGLKTSEVLVQAKHFVDGERAYLRETGYIDYFSLTFDRHEIIYAEGVPVESLMVNDATVQRLPPEIADDLRRQFPELTHNPHFGTEAGRQYLDQIVQDLDARRPR